MKREREFLLRVDELFPRDPIVARRHLIEDCTVQFSPLAGDVWVSELRALTTGEGAGTRALRAICQLADKHQVTLRLIPLPIGPVGPKARQLRNWYARFGFHRRSWGDEMYRPPLRQAGPIPTR